MTPYYTDDQVTLYHGDCLDVLAELPDRSVDAVITDPPYGIRFMGKAWDGADIEKRTQRGREVCPMPAGKGGPQGGYRSRAAEAGRYDLSANAAFGEWCEQWVSECLRILKPGGHLLTFGGSRTWHRLACAVEDAGFEIRDSIAWLYGSGFPKSLDVSKAIDKAAGAERDVVGYRRPEGSAIAGAAPADSTGSHIWTGKLTSAVGVTEEAKRWQGWGTALKPAFEPIVVARKPLAGTVAANVLEHGTGALNIGACRVNPGAHVPGGGGFKGGAASRHEGWQRPSHESGEGTEAHTLGRWPTNVVLDDAQAAELDAQTGVQKSGTAVQRNGGGQKIFGGIAGGERSAGARPDAGYGDEGGASRFFPVFRYEAKAPGTERPSANGVAHPTVKPLDLMRWLVRLVTPPNGVVLDPFAGSGTTAEACIHEHKRCITIEREADYLPLIVNRLSKPIEIGFDFEEPA